MASSEIEELIPIYPYIQNVCYSCMMVFSSRHNNLQKKNTCQCNVNKNKIFCIKYLLCAYTVTMGQISVPSNNEKPVYTVDLAIPISYIKCLGKVVLFLSLEELFQIVGAKNCRAQHFCSTKREKGLLLPLSLRLGSTKDG